MVDLNKVKKSHPSHNYIAVLTSSPKVYKTFVDKKGAVNFSSKQEEEYMVMTFRDASRTYPEVYTFVCSNRGGNHNPTGTFKTQRPKYESRLGTYTISASQKTRDYVNLLKEKGYKASEIFEQAVLEIAKREEIL